MNEQMEELCKELNVDLRYLEDRLENLVSIGYLTNGELEVILTSITIASE